MLPGESATLGSDEPKTGIRVRRSGDEFQQLREQHPAWRLLASRRGPLVLGCLKTVFGGDALDVDEDDATELLAEMLAAHATNPELDLDGRNPVRVARKEIRQHIRTGLLTERNGVLSATDALQLAFRFVESLSDRPMTSTASRLATVQQQIGDLEFRLSTDADRRADHVRDRIIELQAELDRMEAGDFAVLEGPGAVEAIREVYSLASSLRDDFRRVEDSFHQADRALRLSIVGDRENRGAILDRLMASNQDLLETNEGRVFQALHEQLQKSSELDRMSTRLATILEAPAADEALTRSQQAELRRLRSHLVGESARVVEARARSERDVRGYLKTGLAVEHRRIGRILDDLFAAALDVDWASRRIRRSDAPLPPVGLAVTTPSPLRIRVKEIATDEAAGLDFSSQAATIDEIDPAFWLAFDALDREALARDTLDALEAAGRPLKLSELADRLPPTHDLETLSVWVQMAASAGCEIDEEREVVVAEARATDMPGIEGSPDVSWLRFDVPVVWFDHDRLVSARFDL